MNEPMHSPLEARPEVLRAAFDDKQALHAAYIPLFAEGGLFVATERAHRLGDAVQLVLTLPQDAQPHRVDGRVAWITPAHAAGGGTQGVGVCFPGDAASRALKARIETLLGPLLGTAGPTQVL